MRMHDCMPCHAGPLPLLLPLPLPRRYLNAAMCYNKLEASQKVRLTDCAGLRSLTGANPAKAHRRVPRRVLSEYGLCTTTQAVDNCTRALEIEPNNSKALFR